MALFACKDCGNMISSDAVACPKCGAPRPIGGVENTAPGTPDSPRAGAAAVAAAPKKKGMSKGCLTALGCSACLFGAFALTGIGGGAYWYVGMKPSRSTVTRIDFDKSLREAETRARAEEARAEEKAAKEADADRAEQEKLARLIAEAAAAAETATPAPTPTSFAVRTYATPARAVATPVRAPVRMAAATPVRIATPAPTPAIAVRSAVSTPRAIAIATPVMTPVRVAVAVSTPRLSAAAHSTASDVAMAGKTVIPTVSPTPLPWEDPNDASIFGKTKTAAAPAATPAPAIAPSTPVPTPAAPVNPNLRMLHTRGGDREAEINKNLAVTGSDGRTVVGTLVAVKDGFVDIRVNGQLLRIGERDIVDAASY